MLAMVAAIGATRIVSGLRQPSAKKTATLRHRRKCIDLPVKRTIVVSSARNICPEVPRRVDIIVKVYGEAVAMFVHALLRLVMRHARKDDKRLMRSFWRQGAPKLGCIFQGAQSRNCPRTLAQKPLEVLVSKGEHIVGQPLHLRQDIQLQ